MSHYREEFMESSHLFLVGMIIIIATLLGLALKLNRKQEKNILDKL